MDKNSSQITLDALETFSNLTSKGKSEGQGSEPRLDRLGRSYGTGRRKESVARVWVKAGDGEFSVNGRSLDAYFARLVLRHQVCEPIRCVDRKFHVFATVKGGGLSGQAGALRHGLAKALEGFDPTLRPLLKSEGLLKRDARRIERKKPGQPGARKRFQFSKR